MNVTINFLTSLTLLPKYIIESIFLLVHPEKVLATDIIFIILFPSIKFVLLHYF